MRKKTARKRRPAPSKKYFKELLSLIRVGVMLKKFKVAR